MMRSGVIEALVERLEPQARNTTKGEIREMVKNVVAAVLDEISTALANGKRIEVRGFGCFSLRSRAAGLLRNPHANTTFESNERYNVYFRAGKKLAARVDKINQPSTAKSIKKPKSRKVG